MKNFIKKHLVKILLFLVMLGAQCPCCGGTLVGCFTGVSLLGLVGMVLVALKSLWMSKISSFLKSLH